MTLARLQRLCRNLFGQVLPVFLSLSLASALVLWSLAVPSSAGVLSGEDLIGICEPAKADPTYRLRLSQCTGYIIGVSDTFDCKNKTLGFTWNASSYSGQEELVTTVLDWLHFHPNVWNYQASGLVAAALSGKYPCPNAVATQ